MDGVSADGLTRGQQQALDELAEVSAANPAALEILQVHPRTTRAWLPIEISLATAGAGDSNATIPATGPRMTMRARERFIVIVPPQFPFIRPEVQVTHARFAGLPHVQWRQHICLYLSPSTEWHPADGMFGFLERLVSWIDQAAAGVLDPLGAPVHPPVAYPTVAGGLAIIRADAPPVASAPWLGYALLSQSDDARVELVGWLGEGETERLFAVPTAQQLTELTGIDADRTPIRFGLAVLLTESTAFEFPTQARALIELLAARGVNKQHLLDALVRVSYLNSRISSAPRAARGAVYVVVGTPMRGIAGSDKMQHLAVWRLPAEIQPALTLLEEQFSSTPALGALGAEARGLVSEWLELIGIDWARVYEDRPEIIVRRDHGSPMEWARGRRIAIIGCGALGGHVAEHFARAGVSRLLLIDNGIVSPGVLVRQPYGHGDIGTPKVDALRAHLHRVRKDLKVDSSSLDALQVILNDTGWPPDVDLIINAAANPAITAALERQRRLHADTTPAMVDLLIGHTAHRGVATLAPQGYSGGGMDLLRKTKLSTLNSPDLRSIADEFFPDPPRTTYFQPEPGCSEVTFVGSQAEVAALTATLLTHVLAILSAPPACAPNGHAVLMDLGLDGAPAMIRRLSWSKDVTLRDEAEDLDVRIAPVVLAEMRAECRLMARRRSWQTETGGVLLGEVDEACGIAWISFASGPPSDSRASEHLFVCGVEGVDDLVQRHSAGTRGAERFVGLWHSHPGGQAAPSQIDDEGIGEVVAPVSQAPRRALLLIIGAAPSAWTGWLDDGKDMSQPLPQLYTRLVRRVQAANRPTRPASSTYLQALASAGQQETRRWSQADRKRFARRFWGRRRRWLRDP